MILVNSETPTSIFPIENYRARIETFDDASDLPFVQPSASQVEESGDDDDECSVDSNQLEEKKDKKVKFQERDESESDEEMPIFEHFSKSSSSGEHENKSSRAVNSDEIAKLVIQSLREELAMLSLKAADGRRQEEEEKNKSKSPNLESSSSSSSTSASSVTVAAPVAVKKRKEKTLSQNNGSSVFKSLNKKEKQKQLNSISKAFTSQLFDLLN